MKQLSKKAYAKLNLYLRLVGKRPDGFNNLVTIFQKISLHDTLHFKKIPSGFKIHCNDPEFPLNKDNLIYKAYHILKKKMRLQGGLEVFVNKRIPMKAGLGGASSNAAVTLEAIVELYQLNISLEKLLLIGEQLGADVPFFLTGFKRAIATGKGEKLLELPRSKEKIFFLLFLFENGLSTPVVYQNFSYPQEPLTLTKIFDEVIILNQGLLRQDVSLISKTIYNDLTAPAVRLKPELSVLLKKLNRLKVPALMSGSGATIFAILKNRDEANMLAKKFSSDQVYKVKTAYAI